ncbi:acetyl-CoA carboxylase biotin carboxyl carrier protein subunit [Aquabacterium sp.]|uniref:acetyl-CoA carboxylase biotin carboxyl carrier protein subunit n=1 Tax=Aquabacterium sp. TaxID=1872578 RepID=UPI002BBD721C|nr:acetyl-CoA carboxylase biotin carboxyl carrier protein subunit [Aquabacterium sp.]HSW03866.1 acetyl-CoA carboxylase biotin carboxyl carrier protein subunit [Aquabacterium sp.]
MQTVLIEQLSAWLAATDIGLLELRGPGTHLCLRHDGARVTQADTLSSETASASASAPASTVLASAGSVGVFLHRHPLHPAPLAAVGTRVQAGQCLGLLQIGALLLPVSAPRAGIVAAHRVLHGTSVGYGTPLVELHPTPTAGL